jgi:hypothetical protein
VTDLFVITAQIPTVWQTSDKVRARSIGQYLQTGILDLQWGRIKKTTNL